MVISCKHVSLTYCSMSDASVCKLQNSEFLDCFPKTLGFSVLQKVFIYFPSDTVDPELTSDYPAFIFFLISIFPCAHNKTTFSVPAVIGCYFDPRRKNRSYQIGIVISYRVVGYNLTYSKVQRTMTNHHGEISKNIVFRIIFYIS